MTMAGLARAAGWDRGPFSGFSSSSFLETLHLLLPSFIQVVEMQLERKENLNHVQREGMVSLGKWKIELS
jgi:hypothetical protein